jgi:TRAP-type C4-dicarboxylate transport system permease small subunit
MARGWGLLLAAPAAVAGAIVLAMVLAVTLSVTLRATTGSDIRGIVEWTEIGLYLSAVLAAPWLLFPGKHIRADLLAPALPRPMARIVEVAADLIGLAVSGVLLWQAWDVMRDAMATGAVIRRTVSFPEWWLSAPLIPCFALLAAEFARRALAPARRDDTRSVA